MNLIDRYVYAVTKRLPEKQRLDIEKELRTIIDDMLEQYPEDEGNESKVQKVLLDLGDPSLLADSYRESKRYLIGPQNFDNYLFILKIVMGAVFLGISIATVISSFFPVQSDIENIIAEYIGVLISGLLQGFAWVTAAFAIAEYNGLDFMDKRINKKSWSLAELPEIPQKAAVISRSETIVSIIFSTIFTSTFFFAVYFKTSAAGFILAPIFNMEVLSGYKLMILGIFVLGLIREALKLISGRWTLKLSVSAALLSIASIIMTLGIFLNFDIWNKNFAADIARYTGIDLVSGSSWLNFKTGIILIIIIASVIEISTAMYKGIKYNSSKNL